MKSASKILLVIITIIQAFIPKAYGDDNVFDWMNADIMSFTPSPRCIEVPKFSSVNQSNKNLNVAEPNKWVPAGVHVDHKSIEYYTELILDLVNLKFLFKNMIMSNRSI